MKLWIVVHHHKHGQDLYPVKKSGFFNDGSQPHDPDEPTLEEAIALCDDYDEELAKEGIEWVEVVGPWQDHLLPRITPPQKEEPKSDSWFINRYHCEKCDQYWQDQHDCRCNDRCPICRAEIEPYESQDACIQCGTQLVTKMIDIDGTNLEERQVCPYPYCSTNQPDPVCACGKTSEGTCPRCGQVPSERK